MKILLILLFTFSMGYSQYGASFDGIIKDKDGKPFYLDGDTWALNVITFEHHKVHEGSHYTFSIDTILSDADSLGIVIQTPNTTKWAHMVFNVQGSLDTRFEIFETNTADTASRRSVYINNRNSSNSNTTILYNPVAVCGANGTKIFQSHFGIDAGTGANRVTGGGAERGGQEWILKQNTRYMIVIISATASNVVSLKVSFYEHTNK